MNGIAARMDFEHGKQMFERAFPGTDVVEQFKLTQSDLRLEQPIQANNNLYTFPVMVNILSQNGSIFNTVVRLNNQDTFLPQYVGIFLANPDSAVDTKFNLFTYVNQIAFPAAPAEMNRLYNGQFKMMVNNKQLVNGWMTKRHYYVPQTQQTAAFGAGSPGYDQLDGSQDGFYPMQPYVIISGSSNLQINVTLPVAPSTVDAFSRLVVVFRGLLAQNSTVTT